MSIEENKALVRRFFKAINERDLVVLDEIGSPEVAHHIKEQMIPLVYGTFGNHQIEITDMIAEDDRVWVRLVNSGGHIREFMGIAPTGKNWKNNGVYFLRVADGKIVEESAIFDFLNHIKQLGAVITSPPT